MRERNYLPSQKLQDQVVIMSRWLLGEPIFKWIKECKPWLTAGLHANSTLSSHSALAASTRSTESWLTLALFHVGLVLFVRSLCPEQQGPGGGYLSAACLNKKRFICWIICNFLPFCVYFIFFHYPNDIRDYFMLQSFWWWWFNLVIIDWDFSSVGFMNDQCHGLGLTSRTSRFTLCVNGGWHYWFSRFS